MIKEINIPVHYFLLGTPQFIQTGVVQPLLGRRLSLMSLSSRKLSNTSATSVGPFDVVSTTDRETQEREDNLLLQQ